MSKNNHPNQCLCCANPNGPNPIDVMVKEKGMAIVQVTDAGVPPLYYSIGASGPNGDGVEFLMAGLEPECSKSVIPQLQILYQKNPELFNTSLINNAMKITTSSGTSKNAPVYVRAIGDVAYQACCGQLIRYYKEKRIRVLHVFIPDKNGRAFNDPKYDKHLAQIQCPFISQ
jgi:hypothetical protein